MLLPIGPEFFNKLKYKDEGEEEKEGKARLGFPLQSASCGAASPLSYWRQASKCALIEETLGLSGIARAGSGLGGRSDPACVIVTVLCFVIKVCLPLL